MQNGKKHAVETWMSDITGNGLAPEGIRAWTVTDFRRVEPDPALFEIPAEYLPGHDPLLNAKTVFVENETGDPEVKDASERDFNSWRSMTHLGPLEQEEASQGWRQMTVASKQKADIIAVFTSVRNDDDASILPAMEMKIYAPNSDEPLFTDRWASNPNFRIQDELSRYTRDMAAGCVTGLLNRLEHTHRPDNPFAPSRSATTRPSPHHGVNPVTAVLWRGHSCPPLARQSGAFDSSKQRKNERPERRWAILT